MSATKRSFWLAGLLVATLTAAPAAVNAQSPSSTAAKAKAKALYRKGSTEYDLGNFDEAIKLFKRAYQVSPHPNLLFNIAQAYRQLGDCQALFFYKRYLNVAGRKARNHRLVEQRIKELTATCKATEEIKDKPPPGPVSPEDRGRENGSDTEDADDSSDSKAPGSRVATTEGESGYSAAEDEITEDDALGDSDDGWGDRDDKVPGIVENRKRSASALTSTVEIGPAFLDIGDLNIDGAQLSVGAGVAYPISFGDAELTVGILFTYTPVPWDNGAGTTDTSGMVAIFSNLRAFYWVLDSLAVRAEVGAGIMVLTNVTEDSVFVNSGDMVTETLAMFNARFGIGLEYFITDNLMLSASPIAYSYSPARDGLRDGIDAFARFEILAGLGYRL